MVEATFIDFSIFLLPSTGEDSCPAKATSSCPALRGDERVNPSPKWSETGWWRGTWGQASSSNGG